MKTESNIKTEVKNTIQKILDTDCASLACLLDLLSEHPIILENPTLTGSVSAIKNQHMTTWEKLEAICE